MPNTRIPIKGTPLTAKPVGLSRCGMSHATFAQHCFTNQWYEISAYGQIIGSPIDLDFYKLGNQDSPSTRSKLKTNDMSFRITSRSSAQP